MRIARGGAAPRAALVNGLDSIIWRAAGVATVDRILGFDPDGGLLAYVDVKGIPARIDLRSGEVKNAAKATTLSGFALGPGSNIYALDAKGAVVRLSPAGDDWKFSPRIPAYAVFPQNDGSIVVAGGNATTTSLWLLRPPNDSVHASGKLSGISTTLRAQAGDRLYFASGNRLIGVDTRNLRAVSTVELPEKPVLLEPTPSGDRIYAAFKKRREIAVVDRYSENMSATISLPAAPRALRMDPFGRYLLARHPDADSVWVIAVATNRLIESLPSKWLADLPGFVPTGQIALAAANDVALVEPETSRNVNVIKGGVGDVWYFFSWNGFRPRAQGLDEPVTFLGDSLTIDSAIFTSETDSAIPSHPSDTVGPQAQAPSPQPLQIIPSPTPPTVLPPPLTPPSTAPAAQAVVRNYTVSFAALMREGSAKDLARNIEYDGRHPQVVKTSNGAITVYRVIIGPFGSREEAEKVGLQIGKPFWIYQGYP